MRLLYFCTEWSNRCEKQDQFLEEYSATPVEMIDVEDEQKKSREYSVSTLPTLVLVNDESVVVDEWDGITEPEKIAGAVERNS